MTSNPIVDAWVRDPEPEPDDDEKFIAQMDARVQFANEVAGEVHRIRVRDTARQKLAREERAQLDRPQLIRLDEFLARPHDDPTYRVGDLWPTGGRVLLSAQWKAGKTTLVGNLIRSLADGEPFLEKFDVRQADRVVLIDNELDERTLQSWLADQGVQNTTAVQLLPLRGRVSTFDIFDPEARAEWVADLAGADVIILDCLRPIFDAFGLDENHEAGRFLVALDALLHEIGDTEVLVVHHMGHGAERSRGDSRLMDWPDALWKLVRDKDEEDEGMDDPSGSRYFSAFGRDVDHGQAELVYDPTTRHLTLGSNAQNRHQATAHRRVVKADQEVMAVVVASPGLNKTKLRMACEARSADVDAAVERLVQQGLIRRQIVGQSHFHYPGETMLENLEQTPEQPTLSGMSHPVPDTRDTVVSHPVPPPRHGNRVPPVGSGTRLHTPEDVPSDPDTVTVNNTTTEPDTDTVCPHGMTNGNQPDTFLNGRLTCPRCRAEDT